MDNKGLREQARQRLNARGVVHGRDYTPIIAIVVLAAYIAVMSLAFMWGMP